MSKESFIQILIITQDFPPNIGGIQTYFGQVAKNWVEMGHQVTVLCAGSISNKKDYYGAKVISIPIHTSWLFLPLLLILPLLLAKMSITHVVYGQWQVGIPFLLWKKKRKAYDITCVVHGRELLTSVLGPLHVQLMKKVFGSIQRAVVNSHYIESLLKRKYSKSLKTSIAYPGVDPEEFYLEKQNGFKESLGLESKSLIVSLTRLVPRKNINQLMEAFNEMASNFPNHQLVIAGDGPEKPRLLELKKSLKYGEQITFLGRLRKEVIRPFYNMATLYVLPSIELEGDVEGFGIVFLEAGACQTTVIATRSGGIPDAVEDGASGVLVPPNDKVALKEAMRDLLINKEKRRGMGGYARERILKGFTWRHTSISLLKAMLPSSKIKS